MTHANTLMWGMLGCTYGMSGLPWHAVAAVLVMALTERVVR